MFCPDILNILNTDLQSDLPDSVPICYGFTCAAAAATPNLAARASFFAASASGVTIPNFLARSANLAASCRTKDEEDYCICQPDLTGDEGEKERRREGEKERDIEDNISSNNKG
jgi:hypothetical protein